MTRFWAHPIPAALMLVCLLSTPVTYRGGAVDPHPHMFVQLWIDARTGSFNHAAHAPGPSHGHSGHAHHHGHDEALPASNPAGHSDTHTPTLTAFVVSDYGVTALIAPLISSFEIETRAPVPGERIVPPRGLSTPPEFPPPRAIAID